ncbi:MAG: hypothetical protein E7566_04040 [Ruminococcaceae bacterium]|nr:hypothetical protein [Oscillospiraceae bacterium]
MTIEIGDFVTSCEAGYWQLLDIKPKIADEDYSSDIVKWKKGDVIGQWVILKKAFTPKMKPRIDFSYVDASWLKPVSPEALKEIHNYFTQNPDYKYKYENAEIKLQPTITNCWINLSENEANELRMLCDKLPAQFTMDDFWEKAKRFKKNISSSPTSYLINFTTYPWNMDKNANLIYHGYEIKKL